MLSNVTERLSTSRGGAVALGIAAAVLAGILLLVYLDRYRESVRGETADTPVLVAKSLIIKGTSGTQVAQRDQYQAAELPRDEIKEGGIADPAYLSGRIAVNDILPGQQLTTADFTEAPSTSVTTRLVGPQRAISVDIDNVHGSLSQLAAGDRIDIYVAAGGGRNGQEIVKLFRPNVYVLAVPGGTEGRELTGSAPSSNLILQVHQRDAADFAFAADNTQLWFVLRPHVRRHPDEARHGDRGDGPEVGGGWLGPSETILAVDPALDVDSVANTISQGENVQVLAVYSDLDEARGKLNELPFDVLVVASAGYSERALLLIDAAERLSGEPSVLVLSEGSSNGYVRRVLESGADDILMLPQSKEQVAFAIRKILARRDTAAGEGVEPARLDRRARAEGRHRQDADGDQSRRRVRAGRPLDHARRHRPAVRRRRAHARAWRPRRRSTIWRSRAARSTSGSLDHYLMRTLPGRAPSSHPPPDQASAVSAELIRDVYSLLRHVERLRHRRHAARASRPR